MPLSVWACALECVITGIIAALRDVAKREADVAEQRQKLFDDTIGDEPPGLLGGKCRTCGYQFFPYQGYGCLKCGSTDLEEVRLAGRGEVLSTAKVHLHASPDRPTPFTIVEVRLNDGPCLRALADPDVAESLNVGVRVQSKLVPETREGRGAFDLRFTTVEGAV